jgi:hypothetical protein
MSIRQIQANRLNAQQSTGPRSVEGKAAIRMNALKSGIDAKSLVIHGEEPADFDSLQAEYSARWLPITPEQRALVDSLIANEWLLRRYHRAETSLWNDCMRGEEPETLDPRLGRATFVGGAFLDRVIRYKNSVQRTYHVALHELERLQKQELTEPLPANPAPVGHLDPQLADSPATSTPIGFVPATPPSPVSPAVNPAAHTRSGAPLDVVSDRNLPQPAPPALVMARGRRFSATSHSPSSRGSAGA